jgi:TRAP-type C4-dicarboxylate transport system permease small subunit
VGIGYGASAGRHIRMTALHDALPERGRKAMMLVVTLLTGVLLLALTWLSLQHVLGTARTLGAVSPVLQVPLYLVYLAAPAGLLMGAIQYLLAFAQNLIAPGVYIAFGKPDGYEEPPPADI